MDLFELHAKDFGPFEDIKVPLYKQGLIWVTGENRDTKAATNNGSGKTHIFKALAWCLYGESIDSYKGDKVIRRGAKMAEVTATFGRDPSKPWALTRTRKKGAPRLKLISPEGKEHPGKRDEIQARVIEMLGLDFTAFRNTVLYGQGDITRFALPTTKDVDRKDVLHKVLRTAVLKTCHDISKERGADLRKRIKDLDSKLSACRARIEEHDLEGIQAYHDEWEDDRQGEIGQLKLEAREYKEQAEAEMESGDGEDVEGLEDEVGRLEAVAEDGRLADIELEKIEQSLEEAEEAERKAQRDVDKAQDKVDHAEEALAQLDGDECPVCTSPLDEGVAGEHVGDLKTKLMVGEKERDKAEKKHEKASEALKKLRIKRRQLKERSTEGRSAATRRGELREQIAEAKAEAEQAEARAQHAIAMARDRLKQAKAKAAEVNPYAARLKEARARVKQLTKQAEKVDRHAGELRNDLAHFEFWIRGFSNQGLPSFILDAVMPYLTERANHYLETLADGDITMEFTTQRELKSTKGEYRDEIAILWVIEGIEGYAPSGGQMKKMELATDFALMDLMATREGGHLSMLMLDEVLDGLDSEGRQRVLMLLQELRAERGTIFVISHDSDMAEIFEKAITVTKDGGVSTVELAA